MPRRGWGPVDKEAYLESIGAHGPTGTLGTEYTIDCPYCGRKDKLSVNCTSGYWHCWSASCGHAGYNFLEVVATIEGIDEDDAFTLLHRHRAGPDVRKPEEAAPPSIPSFFDIPLPEEYQPVWDGQQYRMPKYLQERGISPATAARFKLGYCQGGKCGGRIILPISSPTGRSWQARATWDCAPEERYRSGKWSGRLLFGWDVVMPADWLVMVEGPFDAMACEQSGLPAVAIMGLDLREPQLELLQPALSGLKSLVICLDGSVEALKRAIKHAERIARDNVFIAQLPQHPNPQKSYDPSNVATPVLHETIRVARPWRDLMISRLASGVEQRLIQRHKIYPRKP